MESLKKAFAQLSPIVAYIINAAFALVYLILYLFAPIFSPTPFLKYSGIKLFSNPFPAGVVILNLLFILAPIAIVLVMTLKKKLCPCLVMALTYTLFIFMMAGSGFGWGWGFIINFIIVLLPWCAFAYLRKDQPATFEQ
jgi:hypothetical protein